MELFHFQIRKKCLSGKYQLYAKFLTLADASSHVLVTGATGFIGAHVVDNLLARGINVRGATRSLEKGQAMLEARPQHADRLDFVEINDFADEDGDLSHAVRDIDGIIHVASVSQTLMNCCFTVEATASMLLPQNLLSQVCSSFRSRIVTR